MKASYGALTWLRYPACGFPRRADLTACVASEHSFPASLPDFTQVKRDRNEAIGAILLVALLLSGCSVLRQQRALL